MQISGTLSVSSIESMIKQVKQYKTDLNEKCKTLVKELLSRGEGIAINNAHIMGIEDTGNLLSSINTFYDEITGTGYIKVNCDYAVFVEFGTGIVGMQNSYDGPAEAMASVGYKYGGGTTYVVTKDGRIGWYYPADDGTWKFTEGQGSRPFMWHTAQELRNEYENIAREVFQ